MANSDADDSSTPPSGVQFTLVDYARWGSGIAVAVCGILAAVVLGATLWAHAALAEHREAALGVGMTFLVFLPIAAIPVALVCLVAAFISIRALSANGGKPAERALWLSLGAPAVVVVLYIFALCTFAAIGVL